ncbi:MAG: GNAT family N-acetyltransferase [Saprospiraceae bacterium]|nr:GNAT family N-acetyltransferase [Saprospiraceae bacterium]
MLTFKSLTNIKIEIIVEGLLASFADYFVQMPQSVNFWKNHWQRNRVRYDLSFGVFDGENLVGFMVNGVDFRDGKLMAFNAGTGVIPSHQGQKIVKQLYNFALPIFKNNGIENFALEVIAQNNKSHKSVSIRWV